MSETEDSAGFAKLLIVPVGEIRALSRSIDQRAVVSGTFEVAADLPKGMSAHAVASAVAAVSLGMSSPAGTWTISAQTGRSNSSELFLWLRGEIARLLRDGAAGSVLSPGWIDGKAGLIAAQLAHVHGLASAGTEPA